MKNTVQFDKKMHTDESEMRQILYGVMYGWTRMPYSPIYYNGIDLSERYDIEHIAQEFLNLRKRFVNKKLPKSFVKILYIQIYDFQYWIVLHWIVDFVRKILKECQYIAGIHHDENGYQIIFVVNSVNYATGKRYRDGNKHEKIIQSYVDQLQI